MEIELRVILLGVGIIILFIVAMDFLRRKPAAGKVRNEPRDFVAAAADYRFVCSASFARKCSCI